MTVLRVVHPEIWNSISQSMKSLFKVGTFSKNYSVTTTLQEAVNIPISAPAGYSAIAIKAVDTGDGRALPFHWSIDGNSNVAVWIRSQVALSFAKATVDVLFMRNS